MSPTQKRIVGTAYTTNDTTNDKGYFATPTALTTAYHTGSAGWFAIVGTTDTVWTWDTGTNAWLNTGSQATGTVTSVSVANANGFSGTVANSTTTPAITIIPTFTQTSVDTLTNKTINVTAASSAVDKSNYTVDTIVGGGGSNHVGIAQTFVPTQAALTGVNIKVNGTTTLNGSIIVNIEQTTAGVPNGTVVCTYTVTSAVWNAYADGQIVTIPITGTLSAGTTYAITLNSPSNTGDCNVWVRSSGGGSTCYQYLSGSWNLMGGGAYQFYYATLYTVPGSGNVLEIEGVPLTSSVGEGFLTNGKIVPSVTSNNLTVAIKTLSGDNPSATNPVRVQIGGTLYAITGALSVTMNSGTNWGNAGAAILGTQEVDWFVYLAYCTASSVMRVYISRVPYANSYGDFGAYNNEKGFVGDGTSMVSGDPVAIVGRFAATLSLSGTGYLWTVPTYTPSNLIQRPIYETRPLSWTTTYTCDGTMTWDDAAADVRSYVIRQREIVYNIKTLGTIGTHADTELRMSQVMTCAKDQYLPILVQDGGGNRTQGWMRAYTDGTLRTTYGGTSGGYASGWSLGASGGPAGSGNISFYLL